MPRVLVLFEPPDGGVAVNVWQLAVGLLSRGWDVEVAGPQQATVYADIEAAGIPIHRLPLQWNYGRPWRDAQALRTIVGLLHRRNYDIVHCHSTKAGIVGRAATVATGTPVIYSPHCFAFMRPGSTVARTLAAGVERLLASMTDTVICVCEAERQAAMSWRVVPAARLRVVLNGCEVCEPDADIDERLLALKADGPLAGVVSVLRPQKRVDVFLEAIPEVLSRLPQARFAVVGDGPLRRDLEQYAQRLGVNTHVTFLSFEPPAARYLRALDVYVLSSAFEALPIGVLEALSCGTPQVATRVGGTPEAVSAETGLVVSPGCPRALADALVEVLSDAGRRRQMSESSRRQHAELFTVGRMVEQTAAVYGEVLGET